MTEPPPDEPVSSEVVVDVGEPVQESPNVLRAPSPPLDMLPPPDPPVIDPLPA